MKDNSNASSYPRALYSIIVSVGLLAVFITFASWVLLSFPIGITVRTYFYGYEDTVDVSSPVSWQNTTQSEVNNSEKAAAAVENSLDSQQLKDSERVDANQEQKDRKKADEMHIEDSKNDTTTQQLKDSERVDANQEEKETHIEDRKNEKTTQKLKDSGRVDANQEEKDRKKADEKHSEDSKNEKPTQQLKDSGRVGANQKEKDRTKADETHSEDSKNEKTTPGVQNSQDLQQLTDNGAVDVNQDDKDKQTADDGKTDLPISHPPPPLQRECDLFHGEWYYDQSGPLYTNHTCPIITQMQNCQGNGRPDKGYENWRWRPSQCELPRFDGKKFLELMSGKTLAFVGDSVARNHMESLLCALWQVEVPKNRGNRLMQRWLFRSKSVMIVRIWSSWLVHQTGEPFKYAPEGVAKVFLDVPDGAFMRYIPQFDVVVLSSGHWFAKQSVYIRNNEIVGTQLWSPPQSRQFQINNIEAFGISVETILTALATHPNYTGITIVRSFSPDHYEGGAWNTGGSCTGQTVPAQPGQLVENGFTNIMHEKQVTGFNMAAKKLTNRSKLKLMDITEVFSYRRDGHPGPYRSPDPNKITKRGPNGRPPPQDCLHWCMPGPIDTWNELMLEITRREYER